MAGSQAAMKLSPSCMCKREILSVKWAGKTRTPSAGNLTLPASDAGWVVGTGYVPCLQGYCVAVRWQIRKASMDSGYLLINWLSRPYGSALS